MVVAVYLLPAMAAVVAVLRLALSSDEHRNLSKESPVARKVRDSRLMGLVVQVMGVARTIIRTLLRILVAHTTVSVGVVGDSLRTDHRAVLAMVVTIAPVGVLLAGRRIPSIRR
jgi:hypothetical protein